MNRLLSRGWYLCPTRQEKRKGSAVVPLLNLVNNIMKHSFWKHLQLTFLVLSFISFGNNVNSTHLVIGELYYEKTNQVTNEYLITLIYYRDCLPTYLGGGNPQSLAADDPAYISIFNGNTLFSIDSVASSSISLIPFSGTCSMGTTPNSCISKIEFKLTKILPPSNLPYKIYNQRCCFSEGINNVVDPETKGVTFTITVPPSIQNSAAIFKPVLGNYLCIHDKISLDHGAVDADGDSLTYEICTLPAGGSITDPKPSITQEPLWDTVALSPPYTTNKPMQQVSIHPFTGLLTINPIQVGNFLVTICCHEWRLGSLINTTRRAYLYKVNDCDIRFNAQIQCDTQVVSFSNHNQCLAVCNASRTVQFQNNSVGTANYFWDFGVPNTTTDTSTQAAPLYQYPASGYYTVQLIAEQNGCRDTSSEIIYVSDDTITAQFISDSLLCAGSVVNLMDQSSSAQDSIVQAFWYVSNALETSFSKGLISSFNFTQSGPALVREVVFNSKGCYATQEKYLELLLPGISAYGDTLVPQHSQITVYAQGGNAYAWSYVGVNWFQLGSSSFAINPSTEQTGLTHYIVSGFDGNGCFGSDTVLVTVTNSAYFWVPEAFTPNGDGLNDNLICKSSSYTLTDFQVYNRWGQLVYHTPDIYFRWQGDFLGKPLAMDSYYWMAHVENTEGKRELKKGSFVIVR